MNELIVNGNKSIDTKGKLLLVEDDKNLSTLLEEYLAIKGYDITLCTDGDDAYRKFRSGLFDLCVLDVMLPKKDGFTLAEELRQLQDDIPIIFLTAKSLKEDKMQGFELGADDYITKPFSMEELLARINAVLRRSGALQDEPAVYQIGKFKFDHNTQMLANGKDEVRLTTKESQLLQMLCRYENRVLQRDKALRQIWGNDSYFTARSMDVFITKLRKRLKEDSTIQIMNVHGTGFKLTTQ